MLSSFLSLFGFWSDWDLPLTDDDVNVARPETDYQPTNNQADPAPGVRWSDLFPKEAA